MSTFAKKIGKKLPMGGGKKEEEPLYTHGGQHYVGMSHVNEHVVGYGPDYGEHPTIATYFQHASNMYGAGLGVGTHYGTPTTAVPHHEGPL
ncbi:hypothetical protein L7F22_047509 [Adiantum nelumboides]|nr:hypothetical protein [Adiantum nelumboides]